MRWVLLPALITILLLAFAAPPPPASPMPALRAGWWVSGHVVVGLRPGARSASVAERLAAPYGGLWREVPAAQAILIRVPEGREEAASRALRNDPVVAYAEPDYLLRLQREPNDTYYRGRQWNLVRIRMPEAWDLAPGTTAPGVAVIDSGADAAHPDLAGKLLPGWNAISDSSDVSDEEGHGTHISGLIAAQTDNGRGIAGVTWSGKVMPIKASRLDSGTQSSTVAAAINWAVDHGARIINLSLGGPYPAEVLRRAVERARERGALLVAAAGNCGRAGDLCTQRNQTEYPAAFPGVLAVAATTFDDQRATYSTAGSYVKLSAPGGEATDPSDTDERHWIFSTVPRTVSASGYASFVGTSQAAPHVAGVAALVWEIAPRLTADDVATVLQQTAVDLGPAGPDTTFGAGRLDAAAALRAARTRAGVPTPTVTPAPTPTRTPTPTPAPGAVVGPPANSPFPWLIRPPTQVFLPTVRRDAASRLSTLRASRATVE